MNRQRPTVVLVMAIMNMVMGGLGLICGMCGLGVYGVLLAAQNAPAGGNPAAELSAFMRAEIPAGSMSRSARSFSSSFLALPC